MNQERASQTAQDSSQVTAPRPLFRVLAAGLSLGFVVGAVLAVVLARESNAGVQFWRWMINALVFVYFGYAFGKVAFKGRWPWR